MPDPARDDAVMAVVERLQPEGEGPFVLACEHAATALWGTPASPADRALVADHWGSDPGAAAVCRALARATGSPAVLSRFSRLLVDPNRPLDSDTLIRTDCDGQAVSFNQDLEPAARAARIDRFWRPYHAALGAVAAARAAKGPALLVSIHSFTPVYCGQPRALQVGVLCTDDGARAARLVAALQARDLRAAVNAPYSGHAGFMYAAARHAEAAGLPALMIELRQDLLAAPGGVAALTDALLAPLRALAAGLPQAPGARAAAPPGAPDRGAARGGPLGLGLGSPPNEARAEE